MFRAAFPGAAQKGSALFLAELFLLKQILGLIEDAAKVVQVAARPKTSSVPLGTPQRKRCGTPFSRATKVLRDGVVQTSFCGDCAAKKLKVSLVLAGPRFERATFGWLGDQDSNLD